MIASVSLERFTFLLLGLSDHDDSGILKICFEYFSKDLYHMSKNIASKYKANYKFMLLVYNDKNNPEIIKISITKLFI